MSDQIAAVRGGVGPMYWTTCTYDAIGRTVAVQAADGASRMTCLYQGNQTTVTDPVGKMKTATLDVQGNTSQVTEPDPANQPLGTLQTIYQYDPMEERAPCALIARSLVSVVLAIIIYAIFVAFLGRGIIYQFATCFFHSLT